MSGTSTPSFTGASTPSSRAVGAAVWVGGRESSSAEGPPTVNVGVPSSKGSGGTALAGEWLRTPTVSGTGVTIIDVGWAASARGAPAAAMSQTATVSAKAALAAEKTMRPVLPTCWVLSFATSHLDST